MFDRVGRCDRLYHEERSGPMSGQRFSGLILALLVTVLALAPAVPAAAAADRPAADAAGLLRAAWSWLAAPWAVPASEGQAVRSTRAEARPAAGDPVAERPLWIAGEDAAVGRVRGEDGAKVDPDG
jgi:hypothetical protein